MWAKAVTKQSIFQEFHIQTTIDHARSLMQRIEADPLNPRFIEE
jgi:hypothetical protein